MSYPYRDTFIIAEMLCIGSNAELYQMKKDGATDIKRFLKKVEREMESGNLNPINPEQFMMNLFALTAHSLLMRPIHKTLFNLSDERYNRLMNEQKK